MKFIMTFVFLIAYPALGQIPEGYYDSAQGLSGQQLRQALHDIIDGHQEQTYASRWTHFQTTDDNDEGKVLDMYSDIPGGNPAYIYTFGVDQCGNYGAEGDFARTYFYMMTRYIDLVWSWNSDMLAGDDLAYWAKEMLLECDSDDPVSTKETDRNNAVYIALENGMYLLVIKSGREIQSRKLMIVK